jgi:Na+/melibiose symporter-like transporter
MNIPIGIAAMALVWWATPETREEGAARSIDFPGVITLVGGIFLLSVALVFADEVPLWQTGATLAASIILIVLFVLIERRVANPIVVLSIFRKRRFNGAVSANLIANFVFGGVVFFMALYLQVVENYGPMEAGLLMLPATIPILIVNPLGHWLGRRFGAAIPTAVGMALLAIAAVLLLDLGENYTDLLAPFILIGIGIGLQITPCAAVAVEDPGEAGEGVVSGVFKASSMIGGSLGVAVGTAVFQSDARNHLAEVLAGANVTQDQIGTIMSVLTGGVRLEDVAPDIPSNAREIIVTVFDQAVGAAMWPSIAVSAIGVIIAVALLRGRGPARDGIE